ncbi:MAG: chromosome segregation protein SMC [Acidobacteria bacterium RIFCSPLOWO2_12_FULL_54_10]|nr:MAG: chromosome segregation protein SMC [Acidobacteria bacterium RIFCSPLOWO2_12_FULL_54_10]
MVSRDKPPLVQRFTNVHLENWRNFRSVDVGLTRRVFLAGANASGKSNFLDVFRFLQGLVSVGGGFQAAIRKRGGISRLGCLVAKKNPEILIHVKTANKTSKGQWEYELQFTQNNRRKMPIIWSERVIRNGEQILNRPLDSDIADPERMTQTYLEQVNVNREYRALADFFRSIRYLHIIPEIVREPDRSGGRRNDPYGGDFLDQVAKTPPAIRKQHLTKIREALSVAIPQLKALEFWRDARGVPHLRGNYKHWKPIGVWQTEEQFSNGTLRLIGLLWAILDGNGPLILEEPELSLHSDVARHLPQMFAKVQQRTGRQFLISTHSNELLQDEGIGLNELLLLEPTPRGTTIRQAGDFAGIQAMIKGGTSLAEAALPRTRPPNAQQLALFGE